MGNKNKARDALQNVGSNLSAREAEKIAERSNLSVRQVINIARNEDIGIRSATKELAQQSSSPLPGAPAINFNQPSAIPQYVAAPSSPSSSSSSSSESFSSFIPPTTPPGEQVVPFANLDLATQGASFRSNEAIALLRENAATERTKLEIANRIPEIKARSKGEINLQKIINAGYKNIKRLESTSNMFSSLMGAFNF